MLLDRIKGRSALHNIATTFGTLRHGQTMATQKVNARTFSKYPEPLAIEQKIYDSSFDT